MSHRLSRIRKQDHFSQGRSVFLSLLSHPTYSPSQQNQQRQLRLSFIMRSAVLDCWMTLCQIIPGHATWWVLPQVFHHLSTFCSSDQQYYAFCRIRVPRLHYYLLLLRELWLSWSDVGERKVLPMYLMPSETYVIVISLV